MDAQAELMKKTLDKVDELLEPLMNKYPATKEEELKMRKPGCFEWYLRQSGSFVVAQANAICRADKENLERIRRAFPQMIAAWEMPCWFDIPPSFEAVYNAEACVEESDDADDRSCV